MKLDSFLGDETAVKDALACELTGILHENKIQFIDDNLLEQHQQLI